MTNSEQNNVAVILTEEMAEQQFQQLNLKELGLQSSDLAEVLTATKELQDMNHQSVAEYGKHIATQTSTYTDELLDLVQNKDLDTTGQKLNQVVQVAQQLNGSSILNQSKSSGFLGSILRTYPEYFLCKSSLKKAKLMN